MRIVAKNKSFTAIEVFALALGIGPNTASFSVLWATMLAPLPYPQANQIDGLKLSAMGVVIRFVGVYTLGHLMRSTLYGIGAFDGASFAAVVFLLFAAALMARYVPARRSARVDR